MHKLNIILLLLLFLSITSYGQNVNYKIQEADSLVKKKEYQKAEELYQEVIKSEPGNNLAVYKLASLYYSEKNYKKAIENYLKLAPNKNPAVLYNLACSYSLINNKSEALKYLREATDNGFSQISLLKTDNDLENIRGEKEFTEILKSVKSLENFPEAKKFDFWVGEWNVYNPQKQKVGDSKIEKILKGAVILENWSGVSGYTGKSFNHFNMDKKKWVQYWVDQNSNSIYFEGNYDSTKKAIVYYSYDHAEDSSPYIRRLTFYNLGADKVRQFSQRSTDKGETWTTEYDFTYIRKMNGSK
ncbi:MAG: tetratricopeptide repeat protein [Ignavibacteriaceae bacterium]|jgi:tetratricopeptide (TPR) repeat protein